MRLRYGLERNQFGVLHEPRVPDSPTCVIVLVHGGFWRWLFNRWVMSLLARDAARRGFTVFNIEYRRLGRFGGGGGWPETFDDVTDAVACMAERFEGAPIVLVGHSAGGHLALATAARSPEHVDGVISMSAPTDLQQLSGLGSKPVDALVAGAPVQDRWSLTSPIEMVPTGVRTVCVHGEADTTVRPAMSVPWSKTWQAVLAAVRAWLGETRNVSSSDLCSTMEGK